MIFLEPRGLRPNATLWLVDTTIDGAAASGEGAKGVLALRSSLFFSGAARASVSS